MAARVIPVSRVTPARRREMQRAYEGVGRLLAADRAGEALPLAGQCVASDPDGRLYVERLLITLEQAWPVRMDRGSLSERTRCWFGVRQLDKLIAAQDWLGVFHHGLSLLTEEPFALVRARLQLLMAIAIACRESKCFDSELAWLQGAHRVLRMQDNPGSRVVVELQRRLAEAHLRRGDLATADAFRTSQPAANPPAIESRDRTAVAELQQAIQEHPAEIENYLALAEHYQTHQEWEQAESVLTQARFVEPSPRVALLLEDVQIAVARSQLSKAQARQAAAGHDDSADQAAAAAVEQLRNECLRIECEIYRSRRDRDPHDFKSRLELAQCLFALGNIVAARSELQGIAWPAHLEAGVARLLRQIDQHS